MKIFGEFTPLFENTKIPDRNFSDPEEKKLVEDSKNEQKRKTKQKENKKQKQKTKGRKQNTTQKTIYLVNRVEIIHIVGLMS